MENVQPALPKVEESENHDALMNAPDIESLPSASKDDDLLS